MLFRCKQVSLVGCTESNWFGHRDTISLIANNNSSWNPWVRVRACVRGVELVRRLPVDEHGLNEKLQG